MRPSVKPENKAENKTNTIMITHCSACGIGDSSPSQLQGVALVMLLLAMLVTLVALITSAEQNRLYEHCWPNNREATMIAMDGGRLRRHDVYSIFVSDVVVALACV